MLFRSLCFLLICLANTTVGYAWEVIEAFETERHWIAYLHDDEGNPFVLKQVTDPDPSEQCLLLTDFVAHQIAEEIAAPCSRVTLIPRHTPFAGKRYLERAATLHTQLPGVVVEKALPCPHFTLHQRQRLPKTLAFKKWGPLPQRHSGLSQQVIETMRRHPDLESLAALDTFVGNGDRSKAHLTYDSTENRFWGGDLSTAFNRKLAPLAAEHLQSLSIEKETIPLYLFLLTTLTDRFPPEHIANLLHEAHEMAGFDEYHDPAIADRLHFHTQLFSENYAATHRLLNHFLQGE